MALDSWLSKLADETRPVYRRHWNNWMKWLRSQSGYENATEQFLLDKQENSNGRGRYEVLDLIQRYITEKKGDRRSTMKTRYQVLRSFFLHNRCELPRDKFDVGAGSKPATQGNLTPEKVKRIIESAGIRDRAIFLSIWQAIMDKERFIQFNESCSESLVNHLKEHGVDVPFRIDFGLGRKRNYQPYYTFLGRDALTAWKEYFEKERGYPKKGEAIALSRDLSHPVNKPVLVGVFRTLRRRTGLKKKDEHGFTGVTIHEFRDVARSTLQLAKRDGFDETCAEFFMGHRIDPLGYIKFTELNPEYVLENYQIAEKSLNIISQHETVDIEKIIDERVDKLQNLTIQMFKMQVQGLPGYHMNQEEFDARLETLSKLDPDALATEMQDISEKISDYSNVDFFQGMSHKELVEYEKEHVLDEAEKKVLDYMLGNKQKTKSRTQKSTQQKS